MRAGVSEGVAGVSASLCSPPSLQPAPASGFCVRFRRWLTVLVYLNGGDDGTIVAGGETGFPMIDVAVTPKLGQWAGWGAQRNAWVTMSGQQGKGASMLFTRSVGQASRSEDRRGQARVKAGEGEGPARAWRGPA